MLLIAFMVVLVGLLHLCGGLGSSCIVVVGSACEKANDAEQDEGDEDGDDNLYGSQNHLGRFFLFEGEVVELFKTSLYWGWEENSHDGA